MVTKAEIRNRYPRKIELDDSLGTPGPSFLRVRPGGTPQVRPVSIRLMGGPDKDSILLFARHLPQEHLLFLHSDVTQPAIVDEWLKSIDNGTTVTLLAGIPPSMRPVAAARDGLMIVSLPCVIAATSPARCMRLRAGSEAS